MGRSILHEKTFPRVQEYMVESDKAVTVKEVAQFLGMSTSAAHGVLQLMELFKMAQKVKRGKNYYVLPGLSEEQIESMLPPGKVSRRRRTRPSPPIEDGAEKYLAAVRIQPGSGELSALAMIRLQPEKDEAE